LRGDPLQLGDRLSRVGRRARFEMLYDLLKQSFDFGDRLVHVCIAFRRKGAPAESDRLVCIAVVWLAYFISVARSQSATPFKSSENANGSYPATTKCCLVSTIM
jgi:hypothetical protein